MARFGRIVPTRRAVLFVAALAPIALLGYVTPWGLDVVIALNGLVAAVTLLDWWRAADPTMLELKRVAPETFAVGRPTVTAYRWRNRAPVRADLRVREVRPSILGGATPTRQVFIAPGDELTEDVLVTPTRRGREAGGWFHLRCLGPLGLASRQVRRELPWHVTVYPSLPASRLKASMAEAVRRREAGLRPVRRLGEGSQFESLREWVPGDDTRHIDWKATARRRKVIVKQFEEERRQQVMLVLDTGRLLTAEVAGEARMEYVVRAALWLAFAASHHDDNVGVMTFAEEVQSYVAPQRGRRGLQQVLDVLAVVEPSLVEPDYPMAFRYLAIRNRKRALTVFFTDVIDRLASEALIAHVGSLGRRHLPLVVTLRNPDLDDIAGSRPASTEGAYRKAAAEELIAAREEALAKMRSLGIIVLDVPPQKASSAVVDMYQELKRRGRL